MTVLRIDIETFSSVDLIKCGVHRYVEASDFEVLLFGYAFGDGPVSVVDLANGEAIPEHILRCLEDPLTTKAAFNAAFEIECLSKHLGRRLDPAQWRCTSVHALYLGLPGNLGDVAKVVGLPQDRQKMTVGRSLIRYFCQPCKPTKANGGRTRNLPHHAPEKWALFRDYCGRDVEVERDVAQRIAAFPFPAVEQRLWVIDQRMMTTGVAVEPRLIGKAVAMDQRAKERLTAEAVALTGLDNPSSRDQLIAWLTEEQGEEVDDLKKKTVPKIIERTDNEVVKQVLRLRQELAKTSVTKYLAMARSMCKDHAIRGLTQFYGANRTGRWAGRLVQVQNLPQNKLRDIDLARNLVMDGDYDTLEMLFGNVPDTLSQLIRTAFVARPGKKLVIVDFSAIEARVIAWMAWCAWRLEVFATHGKIYEASAEQMFKLPPGSVTKKSPYRQKGKVAELACFGANTLVLTSAGPKKIIDITPSDLLWDGEEWTRSGGAICQGVKQTINLAGVEVTPEHLVRIGKGWTSARMAASNESTLCQALATALENSPFLALSGIDGGRATSTWCASSVHAAPSRISSSITTCAKGKAPAATHALKNKLAFGAKTGMPMQAYAQTTITAGVYSIAYRQPSHVVTVRLRNSGIPTAVGASKCTNPGEKTKPSFLRTLSPYLGGMNRCSTWTASTLTEAMNLETSGSYPEVKTGVGTSEQLAKCNNASSNWKPVFDILNSGSRNTFTILTERGPLLVHNCGYQGGPNALVTMGALEMGLTEDELPPIITQWREANPEIVNLWYAVERAALQAVRGKDCVLLPIAAGRSRIVFEYDKGMLVVTLPSQRQLFYVKPLILAEDLVREAPNGGTYVAARAGSLTYEGTDQKTKRWTRLPTYGGKLVENLVQAIARDCLREALFGLVADGFTPLATVHDEVICEEDIYGPNDVRAAEQVMARPIAWAPGLQLRGDGFETPYYMKEID